MTVKMNTY